MAASKNVRCRLCTSWVKLATIGYHVARQCPDAFKKCSFCNKDIKRKNFSHHKEEECFILLEQKQNEKLVEETEILMVTCIYCHQHVKKSEIGKHTKIVCPERMTTCTQCKVQLRKKILKKHLERCPGWVFSGLRMENEIEGEDPFGKEGILRIQLRSILTS